MRWFKADLHIHSVLSPCGGLEMSPQAVMEQAQQNHIEIIAITDHNSLANCLEYEKIAKEFGIKLIYGVEVQTAEEVHAIVLFDKWLEAKEFGDNLYNSLLPIENDPDFFGDQVVINAAEEIVRLEERALINSSMWTFEEMLDMVDAYNGFVFPAHIDATAYSVIAQLGFIPEHKSIIAVGLTAKCDIDKLLAVYGYLEKYTFIRNSDAHYLAQIGSAYTEFYLEEATVAEIIKACKREDGRMTKISSSK